MKISHENMETASSAKGKFNIVLGSYVRSRNACVNCKKSKKKCDEQLPTCGLCQRRNLTCGYNDAKKGNKVPPALVNKGTTSLKKQASVNRIVARPRANSSYSDNWNLTKADDGTLLSTIRQANMGNTELQPQTVQYDITGDNNSDTGTALMSRTGSSNSNNTITTPILQFQDDDIFTINDSDYTSLEESLQVMPLPLPRSLSITSNFNVYLDENGIQFLQYFEEKVSNLLCIDENSSNYLLKTFLTMSLTEESISHALACWGGIFKESNGLNNALVRNHYNKSISLIAKLNTKNNFNYYILLCFHQILMGIKICLGDVQDWFKIFHNCYKLIAQNGGICSLLRIFNNSNDIKWLISNFQYHDILQSNTFMKGTSFPIQDYRLNYVNYGIDPFQGCHNSMILLLGEMLNYRVSSVDYNDLYSLDVFYKKFDKKINDCKPLDYQLNLLLDSDRLNYLRLFELYKVTVRIILLIHAKLMNPKCLDMQLLVSQGLELIDQLIDSNFLSSLTFPLFYVGINVTTNDQERFLNLLHKTYAIYNVGNLIRVKQFILLYWKQNPDGVKFLDWLEMIKELKWELYTG